jgi:hypothetical protein
MVGVLGVSPWLFGILPSGPVVRRAVVDPICAGLIVVASGSGRTLSASTLLLLLWKSVEAVAETPSATSYCGCCVEAEAETPSATSCWLRGAFVGVQYE